MTLEKPYADLKQRCQRAYTCIFKCFKVMISGLKVQYFNLIAVHYQFRNQQNDLNSCFDISLYMCMVVYFQYFTF